MSPATRADRRRAERAAARKSEKAKPAPARKPVSQPRPTQGRRGGFLNTLIIALLVVLVVMLVLAFLVLNRFVF